MMHNLMLENVVNFGDVALLDHLIRVVCFCTFLMVIGLVVRVMRLYKSECDWFSMLAELLRSEVFQHLERFASHHLLTLKELADEIENNDEIDSEKRKLVAFYLIGAAEFLGKQHGLDSRERKILAFGILEKVINVSVYELSDLYKEATNLNDDANKYSIKLGARALGHWLKKGTSNQKLGLQALVS